MADNNKNRDQKRGKNGGNRGDGDRRALENENQQQVTNKKNQRGSRGLSQGNNQSLQGDGSNRGDRGKRGNQ